MYSWLVNSTPAGEVEVGRPEEPRRCISLMARWREESKDFGMGNEVFSCGEGFGAVRFFNSVFPAGVRSLELSVEGSSCFGVEFLRR